MKITTPQLQNENFRFIKVKAKDKKPIEKDWVNTANYKWNDKEIQQWNGNIGIATGFGDLYVLDDDTEDKKLVTLWKNKYPKNFVDSRNHVYFICKDMKDKVIFHDNDIHLGEIQAKGQQVVTIGSTHPSGAKYEVEEDNAITDVKYKDIETLFDKYIPKIVSTPVQKKSKSPSAYEGDDIHDLPIGDVIDLTGFKDNKDGTYTGSNPWHGSTTGGNFVVDTNNNTWICFRCKKEKGDGVGGGGTMEAIAVQEGIITCDKAGKNCFTKEQARKVIQIARDKYGLSSYDSLEWPLEFLINIVDTIKENRQQHLENIFDRLAKEPDTIHLKSLVRKLAKNKVLSVKEVYDEIENRKPKEEVKIYSFNEIKEMKHTEDEYYLQDLFPKGKAAYVHGDSNAGKSIFVFGALHAIARGERFLTKPVLNRGNIKIYAIDAGAEDDFKRLACIDKGALMSKEHGKFDMTTKFNKLNLASEVESCKDYDIVCLDCLRRALIGDDSKSEVVSEFFEKFTKPLRDQGKTVIIIDHDKKPNKEEQKDMFSMRGSGDKQAQADVTYQLIRLKRTSNAERTLHESTIKFTYGKIRGIGWGKDFIFNVIYDKLQDAAFYNYLNEIEEEDSNLSATEKRAIEIEKFVSTGEKTTSELVKFCAERFKLAKISTMKTLKSLVNLGILARGDKTGIYKVATEETEKEDEKQ